MRSAEKTYVHMHCLFQVVIYNSVAFAPLPPKGGLKFEYLEI
jgi:hypothetical protein